MGIGGITSANSMSVMQMTSSNVTDSRSKNIQKEITDTQQQMQKLSSKEDLSANEKNQERKELQKEISDLNTELKQRQEELSRSQKREIMLARLREDQGLTKEEKPEEKVQPEKTSDESDEKKLPTDGQQAETQGTVIAKNSDGVVLLKGETKPGKTDSIDAENQQSVETAKEDVIEEQETAPAADDDDAVTDAGISHKEIHAMVSADASAQQADRLGTVIAKTSDGIAILKGEISQDERRGVDTERKQAELEKMEKREQRAMAFQFSMLGEAGGAAKSAAETDEATARKQFKTENNAFASAMNLSQGEQAQHRFYVSIA